MESDLGGFVVLDVGKFVGVGIGEEEEVRAFTLYSKIEVSLSCSSW